ncbi:MAG: hypothetical protein ABJP45_14580 [Cyclobacteriaceae bacterium]
MYYHEKKSILNIVSTLLIYGTYYWTVKQEYGQIVMSADEELQFWGKTMLLVIPIAIAGKIIVHIIFSITNRLVTKEDQPCFEDERDRLIALKSTRNSFFTFGFGFLLALGAIALGWPLQTMFVVMIVAGVLSDVFDNLSQLYFHQKGI